MSFFDALVYTLAYFPVISALACIDNPLPMPTTVHELRGQSYMRHRASYAGILHESRRTGAHIVRWGRVQQDIDSMLNFLTKAG